ncbi:MAG: DJ-1 family glyoxalase III [Gemmiger sp.]
MSKAVIFFAPGVEECEGLLCVDILRRAGVEVTIAAVGGNEIVRSARGINVVADALAEEVDYPAYDAVILPGGLAGVENLKADPTVRSTCVQFAQAGKVVAAICAAPTALAEFGVLKGRKATVYPGMEDALTAAGAEDTTLPLTVDDNIITGEALGSAIPFALALAGRLAGREAANAVKKGIVYTY